MRPYIPIEESDELHERITDYAERRGLRHSQAYLELLERGVESAEDGDGE